MPSLRVVVTKVETGEEVGLMEVVDNGDGSHTVRVVTHTSVTFMAQQRHLFQGKLTDNPWTAVLAALVALRPDEELEVPDA